MATAGMASAGMVVMAVARTGAVVALVPVAMVATGHTSVYTHTFTHPARCEEPHEGALAVRA